MQTILKQIAALPNFGGFYDEEFTDDYMAMMYGPDCFEHDEPGFKVPEIDYAATYLAVAKGPVMEEYRRLFDDDLPPIFKGLEFYSLYSPREYNFETDRVLAVVKYDREALETLLFEEYRESFNEFLRANYSSRSGFISFVPNNIEEWERKEWRGDDAQTADRESRALTVALEFLADLFQIGNVIPEELDGTTKVHECIVFKD